MKPLEERILDTAKNAAEAAGEILVAHAGGRLRVNAEAVHDLKLEVDVLAEKAILSVIHKAFPDHGVLAEESGTGGAAGPYTWIVDPLDGTVNYYFGIPYWCTSIACYRTSEEGTGGNGPLAGLGRPVAGVVYAPCTGDLFSTRAGAGAFLNGRAVRAGSVQRLDEALLVLGFGKTDVYGLTMAKAAVSFADKVRKLRCLGAAALDLAGVACGRVSGFFETGLRTWDIAAGAALIREAGGMLRAEEFEPTRWRILASAPGIHQAMQEVLEGGD